MKLLQTFCAGIFIFVNSILIVASPMWENPPKEHIPPLTEELVKIIKMKPIATARIKKTKNGAVQLFVNNVPRQPLMGAIKNVLGSGSWSTEEVQVGVWKDVDYDIVQVSIGSLFVNQNKTKIVDTLWRVLRVYPNAKMIIWLRIAAAPGWCIENPDEVVRNEKGQAFIIWNGAFDRLGDKPNAKKGEKLAWSFSSKKFKEYNSRMLKKFITTVNNSIPGRAVIGYKLTGGADNQLYRWHAPNSFRVKDSFLWGDYSKPSLKAWRKWLRKRYGSIKHLQKNWQMNVVSFEIAPAPKASSLIGHETFHNPKTERQAIDWKLFLAESRSKLMIYFANEIKKHSSNKNIIVGTAGGESGVRSDVTANWMLMQSNAFDFFVHQPHYGVRRPPSSGGIGAMLDSYQLNEKLFLSDTDHLTWLIKPHRGSQGVIHWTSDTFGRADDMNELRSMWRREFGRLWASGCGMYFNPLRAPYTYLDKKIKKEFIDLKVIAKSISQPSPQHPAAEMAVIYDERSIDYLKGGLRNLHLKWAKQQFFELDTSGVPFRRYYADDLRSGKIPPAKIYVFINLLNFDKQLVSQIDKLKRDNATLVFMQSSGFVQAQNDIKTVAHVIGMNVRKSSKTLPYKKSNLVESHCLTGTASTNKDQTSNKSLLWPKSWDVFGPFTNEKYSPKEMRGIPKDITVGGHKYVPVKLGAQDGYVNLAELFPEHKKGDEAFLFAKIDSPVKQTVKVGAGADWWMQCWVNGKTAFDTLAKGNMKNPISVKNHTFELTLDKGKNILAFRIISGTHSFLFASCGPGRLASPKKINAFKEGIRDNKQSTLAVIDKKSQILAVYPKTGKAGFAVKNNGNWTSVFIGTHCISSEMINRLAGFAQAWKISPSGYAVAASDDLLMVHPLKSGDVTLTMREPTTLTTFPPRDFQSKSKKKHIVNMNAGETWLFKLQKNN